MMRLPTLVATLLMVLLSVSHAAAVTARDLIELTRAGLGDDVLVALVEADRSLFELDARQILELRAAGVSERVLVAMLKSDQQAREALSREAPKNDLSTADMASHDPSHEQPGLPVLMLPVTVPVFVPVPVAPERLERPLFGPSGRHGFGRFINDGFNAGFGREPIQPRPAPVYWGWGGKRRPDTWKESQEK